MYQFIVKVRSSVLVFLTHYIALPLLQVIRNEEKFPYTSTDLENMPDGSLGKQLTTFLHNRNLKLLPYYVRHDIKHILLDYDTTDKGEVCLQCFMLGNKHLSFPVIITVVYGIVTMPEHWSSFKVAYQRGKNASVIENWKWFEILHESVVRLQEKMFKN